MNIKRLFLPVHCQSISVDHLSVDDDRFGLAFVDRRFVDPLVVHVTPLKFEQSQSQFRFICFLFCFSIPEEHSGFKVEVEGCGTASLVHDGRKVLSIKCVASDIRPVGEEERGMTFVRLAPSSIMRVPRVTCFPMQKVVALCKTFIQLFLQMNTLAKGVITHLLLWVFRNKE